MDSVWKVVQAGGQLLLLRKENYDLTLSRLSVIHGHIKTIYKLFGGDFREFSITLFVCRKIITWVVLARVTGMFLISTV